jgi:hypothetical protein
MTLPAADLVGEVVRPFWLAYVDIDGDPLYASTLPQTFTPTGTGDPDLDGIPYLSLPAGLVTITPLVNSSDGASAVEVELTGIPVTDGALLDLLAVAANWRGRSFRLWRGLANSSFVPTTVEAYHTGYMMSLAIGGGPSTQSVRITSESWLAALTTPRAKTYQDQADYDATDNSAARIRAAANGVQTSVGFLSGPLPMDQRSFNDYDGGFG